MSKKIYLFSLVLLALAFTACSETEEVGRYDNWQARSDAFIDSIANVCNSLENKALPDTDPEKLYAYEDETNNQMIYVKKLQNGNGTEYPMYTSKVSAYYRMSYFNGDVIDQCFTGAEPTEYDTPKGIMLGGIGSEDYPVVISGWAYTLVYMKAGDFWRLYIPYQSGYDSSTGNDTERSLQPYSALVSDVKLDKIVER